MLLRLDLHDKTPKKKEKERPTRPDPAQQRLASKPQTAPLHQTLDAQPASGLGALTLDSEDAAEDEGLEEVSI